MTYKIISVFVFIFICLVAGCKDEYEQCYGDGDNARCYSYEYNLDYHDEPTVIRLPFYAEPLQRETVRDRDLGRKIRSTYYKDSVYSRGVKLVCLNDVDSSDNSHVCSVLSWQGHVYWVYSDDSNWWEVSIIAAPIEDPRNPVKRIDHDGGRYLFDIRIETRKWNEQSIVLILQDNREIEFNLDELRIE